MQIVVSKKDNGLKYCDMFIKSKISYDLLKLKLFPNTKEITESMGIMQACIKICELTNISRKDIINIVVVGDGHRPRTATLISRMSKWITVSIDPEISIELDIPRVTTLKYKIEDINLKFNGTTIICCPHSHAKLSDCLKYIQAPKRHIISLPCCVKDDIGEPDISYIDKYILSPKNKINIYLDI